MIDYSNVRKYGLQVTTLSLSDADTNVTVTIKFINNGTFIDRFGCDDSKSITTSSYTFTPGGLGETVEINFFDKDIGFK